jgi:hypothetical protein
MIDPSVISGIGGAIGGSTATGILMHVLSKPKVKIDLQSVVLRTPQPNPEAEKKAIVRKILSDSRYPKFLRILPGIREIFTKCDYVSGPNEYYRHPIFYTYFLFNEYGYITRIKLMHKQIPGNLQKFKAYLNSDLIDDFLVTWHPYHRDIFWLHLLVDHIREEFDISLSKELENKKPVHRILRDEEGDFFLNIGKYKYSFPWSIKKDQREIGEKFAERVAKIFAHEDVEKLKEIIGYLGKINWEDPSLDEVARTIESELDRCRKMIVKGIVVNSGKTSVAISGKGRVIISASEFEYQSEGKTKQRINEDIPLPITIMKENMIEEYDSIVIRAGEAVCFEAHSDKYLFEQDDSLSQDIQAIYNQERECYVEFRRLDNRKFVKSNTVLFREF